MNKILRLVLNIAVILPVVLCLSCKGGYPGTAESITVAYSPYVETALYWIAEDQNFFRQNGLQVTFLKYETLLPALDAMSRGEVDIVGNVTEFPLAGRVLEKTSIRTIGCIARSYNTNLVGRKDRGIEKVADLKGKRVGSINGTITDFYLVRLLELNGMNKNDITFIDVKTAANSVNAVVNGDVDAAVVGQPFANSARNQLGSNAFFQPAQSGQSLFVVAVCTKEFTSNHPELVGRFVKSLVQAEEYLANNPANAQVIVQKRLGIDEANIKAIWPQDQFTLSLDQSLIAAMEDEARWLISNNLTGARTVPVFGDYIYEDALKAVRPEAVNIIR